MLPFIRKKNNSDTTEQKKVPEKAAPVERFEQQPPVSSRKQDPPGVQMLKQVWHIGPVKKKKEMAPPGVSSDIYCVPKQRQMPPRHSS